MPIKIAVVIVVIPVPLRVPVTLIFIPPPMPTAPAPLACFLQIMARAFRLLASRAMMFNRLVELMIRMRNPALAIIIIRPQSRRSAEQQKTAKRHCGNSRVTEQKTHPSIPHTPFLSSLKAIVKCFDGVNSQTCCSQAIPTNATFPIP